VFENIEITQGAKDRILLVAMMSKWGGVRGKKFVTPGGKNHVGEKGKMINQGHPLKRLRQVRTEEEVEITLLDIGGGRVDQKSEQGKRIKRALLGVLGEQGTTIARWCHKDSLILQIGLALRNSRSEKK